MKLELKGTAYRLVTRQDKQRAKVVYGPSKAVHRAATQRDGKGDTRTVQLGDLNGRVLATLRMRVEW